MSFTVHTSIASIPSDVPVAYLQKAYLEAQDHPHFRSYSDDHFFLAFNIQANEAISLPKSPFGSVFLRRAEDTNASTFLAQVKADLRNQNITRIQIKTPAPIYKNMMSGSALAKLGFQTVYDDINQHIDLTEPISLHQMQQRKLKALQSEGFTFQKMINEQLETAHQFLTVCRQSQGLSINIPWETLNQLNTQLPDTYDCFGIFRNGKISALCICVRVSEEVAYYYLPGTSPMFRNQSPMVMLITGMVDYYRDLGVRYFDMGVSSIEGKPQETLKIFKERMGAALTTKATVSLDLT